MLTAAINATLTAAMPAPVGRLNAADSANPATKQSMEITTASMIIALKPPASFLAVIAGKIIKLDINSVPIMRIPATMVTAVKKAIKNWDPAINCT